MGNAFIAFNSLWAKLEMFIHRTSPKKGGLLDKHLK
jgi:hypothetical protein